MSNPHGSFIWYEYLAADAAAAKAFYDPVVGWNVESQAVGAIDYHMIRTPTGTVGGLMELTQQMRDGGARTGWLGYIGVDDVDATVALATEHGGGVLMPAFDMPGVGRMALIADQQGAPVYVMRGESDENSDSFAPDSLGHGAWNELTTTDLDAARRFYPLVFGWTLGDNMPMGPMGDYQFIEHGGQMIGAMMQRSDARPAWEYCFRIQDVDQSLELIRGGGGTVTHGPTEVPGGDRVVQAIDHAGAPFMLVSK